MKVLLINHFPLQGSGSGIYTLNIAQELIKESHEVFVIDIDCEQDNKDYSFQRRTIICDETKNENPDLSFNFPCFTTHPRSINTYYNISDAQVMEYVQTFIRITEEVVADFKPDIIHAQHLWITPYAALKTGIPYVVTVHGTDLMGFKKDKRYHKYALEGANNAKKIITISRQVHNDTLRLYKLPEDKLKLNPNGFDDEMFRPKSISKKDLFTQFGLNTVPEKLVSFVGKFTDFKGIDILIKAARKVTDEIPEVVFALAGDGQLMEEMNNLASKLGLTNIYFIGHQTQEDVASLYSAADVSVVPSRIEPFGLVAIEALGCGTPVVATNAGGLPDFVNDEVGQLVEMENVDVLANAIIEELKNNTKLTKGKYAREYAVNNYSWKKTLQNVISIYEETIN
ncbi:MAG: glycosyltransferase family 4 protein [Candidatus Cloacimonadota bacterium]|nr:MAG: glycosyltransferase family 4 protein [Candidatus Cloacimonadota bacterium]HHE64541.1 glycosyltransferase family 1 protein [Bacteroidota bacterium]